MSPTKRIALTRGKLAAPGRILGACEPQSPTPRRTLPRGGRRARGARGARGPLPVAPPPPEPPAAVAPVMVPRWIQLVHAAARAARRCARSRARPGPVLLLFIIAGLIALLLNPLVTLLRRARLPARRRGGHRVPRAGAGARPGSASCSPTRSPTRSPSFRDNVPGIVDDANASLADLQGWLDRNGIDLQVSEPGRTAVESLGDRVAEGSGELAAFTRDALLRLVEASIAVILIIVLVGLHAALRRAHRRGRAPHRAARRRHAGGRLPDADPGRGVRLRARPAAVLADHGHERGRLPVGPRLARDLPRRQDLRVRVRRVLRLRRADPVHRPGGRRVPAGDDRAVQPRAARRAVARRSRSPRCSRSRATSSPRTCSGTRCASTRCW